MTPNYEFVNGSARSWLSSHGYKPLWKVRRIAQIDEQIRVLQEEKRQLK